ncbi:MAG: thioredoxin domain-containing protein [Gemmatimonadetes bacterium]|uniref:Thioredoxin domain-containing protein n=1 Tax=Candidatus Kutchimonas denitrificans TaxID=3056748 RepID=A0AAE5CCU6_9BACT|nr:thioredoxin domain-containing protein [Gemmatimonadota bacterium]NIR76473.1 thioredoxin domain-containing protein [Candidatus Kutchimonas denitrificans]NIS03291.1 thioredoxin domain-containing protein [Gemmatimonadota bacterium]NIT69152.1 thioredoxin domain-containing protein [Gemmatimonadota bacterium]NIU54544.1 thioredoxin domain-containing protein [Gemmatimonadota bacterium]
MIWLGFAGWRRVEPRLAAPRRRSVGGRAFRHLILPAILLAWATGAAQDRDYGVLGSPEAPLEMTVFSDFECPACRNFALAAQPAIAAEFVATGRLRIRYVYFPLAAIHPNAVAAAKAAHCAGRAGRFWEYHDYLFVRQPEWAGESISNDLWIRYADNLGIETEPFAACLAADATHAAVESDLRAALRAGATGTPTIVIGGESLSGLTSYAALRRRIVEALNRIAPPDPEGP